MGIFDVFKKGKSQDKGEQPKPEGKYMPQSKLPIDERFMKYFIENGGKFIYCENQDEVLDAFDNILLENDWYESEVCCLSNHFTQKFDGFNLEFNTNESSKFYLGGCEYLIANNGALLVTSNQIKEKKLSELPSNFVILAGTSQLVEDISEGLRRIKSKSKTGIPSNITTIKHFGESKSDDFMAYGSTTKNLYLLLLEDL
ncbi:LUD domain-containing protein [Croceibacter atlanticus]|jgi:L-lactate utilization protein LutC|uniref:LUD domain-containing protein n=1 Tax=Croceibacter atlanticus TaxID=313588 RepID=UPI0024BB2160|nr:LUD domain-containing protein [Croceibacter atlanticus]